MPWPAVFYYLGLAALLTHEIDAALYAEWRLLFVFRDLPDATAAPAFVLAHFPLLFAIFWLGAHRTPKIRNGFRQLAAAFFVVHAGLHTWLANHPRNDFDEVHSYVVIYAAAVFGVASLVAHRRGGGGG